MEPLALSNQICFSLYALTRQITNLYRPYLDKLDLTYPQYLVMMALWEHTALSVKELGALLLLDSGTLTPLLKRMEEKGLVIRKRSREDERVVVIELTTTGKNMKKKACNIPEQLKAQLGLSNAALLSLHGQLQEVLQQLQANETE